MIWETFDQSFAPSWYTACARSSRSVLVSWSIGGEGVRRNFLFQASGSRHPLLPLKSQVALARSHNNRRLSLDHHHEVPRLTPRPPPSRHR